MPEVRFIKEMASIHAPVVLELGSRRVEGTPSTLRKNWLAPHAREYIGTDIQEGDDVDIVTDLHNLSESFGENRFDGIVACSVLEHIQYPWIAVVEICRVLKPGGFVFMQTHHSFPIHAHPSDYWRFTEEGLRALFHQQVGFEIIGTRSDFPCAIISEREPQLVQHPSFLNVIITARKIKHPPCGFIWQAPE